MSRLVLFAAGALAFALAGAPAQAGGYSSSSAAGLGATMAKALAKNYTAFSGSAGRIEQKSYAFNDVEALYGGKIITGTATAGNSNSVQVGGGCDDKCGKGHVVIKEHTDARSKTYVKGKNLLLKARAQNYLQVKVDGQLWYEGDQEAHAMTRFTPIGSQAYAWARNNGSLEAKGYVRYSSGNVATTGAVVGR
jgi:hypothetical protein